MSATYQSHELNREETESSLTSVTDSLALVDVESYPAFVGRKIDYFDMMAHFSEQMQALTVLPWKAPEQALRLRFRWAENNEEANRVFRPDSPLIASGNLRCFGRMALVTHDRLFDCARHRTHTLLRGGKTPPESRPHVFNVPPGVYAISLHYHAPPAWARDNRESWSAPEADYTILLRHYAFPPPRVAPHRLSGGFFDKLREITHPEGVITSHARVWG